MSETKVWALSRVLGLNRGFKLILPAVPGAIVRHPDGDEAGNVP